MAASPQIARAFEAWKLAEMACHYAEPCPDEVMNNLVSIQSEAFTALQAMEPGNGDDMLLKLFPVLMKEFEPKTGDGPFWPTESRCYDYGDGFFAQLRQDLGRVCPALGAAIAEPHPCRGRQ